MRLSSGICRLFAVVTATCYAALLVACRTVPNPPRQADEGVSLAFSKPQTVSIKGYKGDAMEPFLTRDGQFLIFNNLNDPGVHTKLFVAKRIDDLTFQFMGEVLGANSPALNAVATMDRSQTMYFISTRSYDETLGTIYRGDFKEGRVTNVKLVPGVKSKERGLVVFDVDVSDDGQTMCFATGNFKTGSLSEAMLSIADKNADGFEKRLDSDVLMQNLNSKYLQYAPCISADKLTIYFTRYHQGDPTGPKIYVSRRPNKGSPFGLPQRLIGLKGFVEAPTLTPDEQAMYFHKKIGSRYVIMRATREKDSSAGEASARMADRWSSCRCRSLGSPAAGRRGL